MKNFYSIIAFAICITSLISCDAPQSENGPVTYRNMTRTTTRINNSEGYFVYNVKTKGIGKPLGMAFNDKNDVQLQAAQAIGIKPIESLKDAFSITKPIVEISSCDEYVLDSLTHSMPYLIPKAASLLKDIGKAFTDTVEARGGKRCRMIVTSVLRTDNTINKLRRRNRNATEVSCHLYGTTFDISWRRFHHSDSTYIMSTEDLKNILGEVLYKMRADGRCYVKFERKQSCYHITTR
ncbi:MAG: hypothetical protein E7080_06485 [Bacteroidales bacterium]|nr:hypothetical protein [Bacteroidales bacterium]